MIISGARLGPVWHCPQIVKRTLQPFLCGWTFPTERFIAHSVLDGESLRVPLPVASAGNVSLVHEHSECTLKAAQPRNKGGHIR